MGDEELEEGPAGEKSKVLAKEQGSAGRSWLLGFGARVALAGGGSAMRTLAPACGAMGLQDPRRRRGGG